MKKTDKMGARLAKALVAKGASNIQIPSKADGLIFFRRSYHVWFYLNGKRTRRDLKTTSIQDAVYRRDEFFKVLRSFGVQSREDSPRKRVQSKEDAYIYFRDPYVVRVGSQYVGTAKTKEEARNIRDEYMEQIRELD